MATADDISKCHGAVTTMLAGELDALQVKHWWKVPNSELSFAGGIPLAPQDALLDGELSAVYRAAEQFLYNLHQGSKLRR